MGRPAAYFVNDQVPASTVLQVYVPDMALVDESVPLNELQATAPPGSSTCAVRALPFSVPDTVADGAAQFDDVWGVQVNVPLIVVPVCVSDTAMVKRAPGIWVEMAVPVQPPAIDVDPCGPCGCPVDGPVGVLLLLPPQPATLRPRRHTASSLRIVS